MSRRPEQGIRANLAQFALLVLTNGFVGAMVGVERSIMPELAREEFGLASGAAATSFLISFGLTKALGNLVAGRLADRWGRRRVLITGWVIGIPAPLLVVWAPGWSWVVAANVLLGINQALCWSVTVIMKIDLAGPDRRGVATAANEWAGYVGVALAALASGYLAGQYAPRPAPFYVGVAAGAVGLLISLLLVRDTGSQVRQETEEHNGAEHLSFGAVFRRTTWRNPTLRGLSQAGLATNLKDGVMWGLVPAFLGSEGVSMSRIGVVAAVYPAVWGFGQAAAGPLSDRWGRKKFIVGGMFGQAAGVGLFAAGQSLWQWIVAAVVIGLGTAAVYPTLLAAVSDVVDASWRASSLGVFRLWRDMGYAVAGAAIGLLADSSGNRWALGTIAGVVFLSGAAAAYWVRETLDQQGEATVDHGDRKVTRKR